MMDFGRQPQPVLVVFSGDPRDVEHYKQKIASWIERTTYDLATSGGPDRFIIYPRAVND